MSDITASHQPERCGAMCDCLAVPQGIPTLAHAEAGTRVVVHSVMIPYRLIGSRAYPAVAEDLLCTRVVGDQLEFEREDGSRFFIERGNAQRVRVEDVRAEDNAEWCGG